MTNTPSGALDRELRLFEENRERFLAEGLAGRFVLIKGEEIVGFYPSPSDAYNVGIQRFGNVPMLIKKVSKDEPTASVPALTLGLIHAGR